MNPKEPLIVKRGLFSINMSKVFALTDNNHYNNRNYARMMVSDPNDERADKLVKEDVREEELEKLRQVTKEAQEMVDSIMNAQVSNVLERTNQILDQVLIITKYPLKPEINVSADLGAVMQSIAMRIEHVSKEADDLIRFYKQQLSFHIELKREDMSRDIHNLDIRRIAEDHIDKLNQEIDSLILAFGIDGKGDISQDSYAFLSAYRKASESMVNPNYFKQNVLNEIRRFEVKRKRAVEDYTILPEPEKIKLAKSLDYLDRTLVVEYGLNDPLIKRIVNTIIQRGLLEFIYVNLLKSITDKAFSQ